MMNDERPDQMMMIGLHKLASQLGDGLVSELYEVLTRRTRLLEDNPNVTEFPAWQARSPLREPFGLEPSSNAVILPFPRSDAGVSEKKARER
ncbi:hypothetical protein N181_09225 [Sinorhizobium fredii USDA 205]|uniref:Uncharacterized protein n=2 Tax=Rhizobium fredii TaxID=380 RepID=G9A981_SINF1|nr:hypothetical protein SF83666_c25500 [Sinorhizobium fredii CCBAU 83666]AWI58168.1 hypothetical protein AB395_00002517 [Sinorhizobium fredii CCBAU 45436]AWM26009.1 hypothetical protein AOX55_00002760 [Sinorhizobium fredii CCBAU 25509]KSV91721.1 hypothetical protein N181_09225 [Sinorhizobium fredii USDA 205]CCE96811.1 hypothetical protein SFHH103_02316 [Sinorhizobium fredii HH103]